MGNKGRPKTARPLANFSNASPALSDAAPEGQATRRDAKTAPVLHAATLPSIPTLAEASSKGLAPATVILSPQWRDGTPAYIPPPAGAKVGSAPSLPPPAPAQAAAAQRVGRGGDDDGGEYNPSAKPPPPPPADNGDDDEVDAEEEDDAGERGGKGRSGVYIHWRPMEDLLLVKFGTSLRVLIPPTSSHKRRAWVSMSFPSPPPFTHSEFQGHGRPERGEEHRCRLATYHQPAQRKPGRKL